nr:ribonuclease H-like domain-containing protein [Tanacetum cinerariifolium]
MSVLPDDQMNSVINCLTAKSTWNDLILYHKWPYDVKESSVMDLKLVYNTFKFKEGESLTQTFTRYKALVNELVNDGIKLSKLKINTGFINRLPKKWLSFCQSLRSTNHVKDSEIASLFGKLKYEKNLIDNIYKTEKSKSLVSVTLLSTTFFSTSIVKDFQDSPDDEEDTRSSHEYLNDLEEEYQLKARLAKSKRFFKKGTQRFGSAKATDQTECHKCALSSFSNKNKGLIAESHDWDEEEVSSDDEKTKVKTLMAFTDEEKISVSKETAKNGEGTKITIKKVHTLLEMEDNDDIKSFLDYLCIDLNYVEEQRNNLSSKHRNIVQELNACKEQLLVLKQAKLNLLTMQHVNTKILKDNQSLRLELKELNFITETWLNSSNKVNQCITNESSVCSTPLLPLRKLDGVEPGSGPKTDKLILKSKSTFKAKTLKGITLNEPSSASARGTKSSSASKTNSAPAGKLKNVNVEDDPPFAMFPMTGYGEEVSIKETLRKSLLPPRWSLANGIHIDYANIFWEDIILKLKKKQREKVVPHTQFLSLLIMHKIKEDYGTDEVTLYLTQIFSVNNWALKPNQPKEPPFTDPMLAICALDKPVAFKAPKTSSKAESEKRVHLSHGLKPKLAFSFYTITEMDKEDQQATGGPTSLGVTSKEKASPQLSSDFVAEVDPRLSAYNDSIPPEQGMDERTKNTSYDHISASTDPHVLADQTKSVSEGLETVLTQPTTKREQVPLLYMVIKKRPLLLYMALPLDVYANVNHDKVSKEICDRVKLLMQGTKLSLQERECKLYDEFDKFSFVKGLAIPVFTQEDGPIVGSTRQSLSCQLWLLQGSLQLTINLELSLILETKPLFKTTGLLCNKFKGGKDKVMLVLAIRVMLIVPRETMHEGRDKAIIELRQKFKKAKKEKDDLKLTLEKFQDSSKNLSRLLDGQQSDKSKTGLGYDSQGVDSQVELHAPKPNFVFADEHVVSESITSLPGIAKSEIKTSKTTLKNVSVQIIKDWVSDSEDEDEIETKKSVKKEENNRQTKYLRKNSQLPRDCDKKKKMVEKPVWNNARRDQGIFNSGCSRHMTGNKSFLTTYQELDCGFVAFGGSPKGGKIYGKGKIRTGKLDFEDVYFVKELKFKLLSVSQISDKKNSVFFTETECLILSPDFKIPHENQVLLKVPIHNNLYIFNLKNVASSGVNTACYIQNRVLVTKPYNKTPYELLLGRSPNIDFMKPFGCLVTILNTLDHLGKFEENTDEGFLVGYSVNRQAGQEKASNHEYILLPFMPYLKSSDDKDADEVPGKGNEGVSKETGIFNDVYDDREVGTEADTNNLELLTVVSPIPTIKVHKDHPKEQIIKDLNLATQTRRMINFSEENVMVKQKDDGIFISQDKYVADILKKFGFSSVKTASTLMEPNKVLIKDAKAEDVDVHVYRSMIGSLMYLTASRPDIMFAVCACARDSLFDLDAFSDSDYAGASLDKKSTTGGCQFLGKREGFVMNLEFKLIVGQRLVLNGCLDWIATAAKNEIQFWTSAEVKTINEDVRLQALVDGKKVIINEENIRRDLKLDDAEAPEEVGEIPTDTQDTPILIQPSSFQPERKYKSGRKQRKETETNQATKIEKFKKRVKKLEGKKKKITHGLKRLYKVGLTARVESSEEEEGLGDQEDASKQGRIAGIDADEDLSLINETAQDQGRIMMKTCLESMILMAKDKGKGIMVELEKPLKKKCQIAFDEEVARKLDAQMKAEIKEVERIAREKDEANRNLSIKERSKLLAKLIKSRRKYFAAKRAKEIRNKPPIKAQQKSLLCTYMKNMVGYKQKDFKGKIFEAIKKMFDKVYKRVNTFMAMDSEVMKGSKKTQAEVTEGISKRARDEIEQESAKRQRLEKEDDIAELKRCLEIVPEDDDDVTIKATPLSSKSPTIVDYKIYKEGKKSYFKIIRAYGNSQNYLTFRTMFKNFNKEDLEVLRSIVKERFKKTKPVNDMDNILFQILKTMFEHCFEYNIWKYQQRVVKVHNWKLYDSCRVYFVTTHNMVYYLLVEKIYPFTNNILHQLWKDVRLQEQADILSGIVKQAKAKQLLDNALDFAYKHDKRIKELLVYVRDTCPNANKPSEKLVAVTPMNKVKKVRFFELLTSSSNIHKQVESTKTLDSNTLVLPSTGLKSTTGASRSQPTCNKKNDMISQTQSTNMKNKVEVQLRRANLCSNKKNHVKDPICDVNVKHTILNANSELIYVKYKQLVPNPIPQQPFNPPTKNDWDSLFQPMFDEYFNPLPSAISIVQVVDTPRVVDLADSPMSTTIDQDAPSTSIPSTQEQEQSPIISQGVEESPKTPHFHDDPLHEDLTSQGSSTNVRPSHTPFELFGRVEFCLVTGFACWKVVFPKYLDDGIPPFVRRIFLKKLKKLEKNKAGLEEVSKGKATQPSDKSRKDSVTIGHFGELVPDKETKGKAAQPSDKGDKVNVTIRDLGELVQKDAKWKKLSLMIPRGATDGEKVSGEAMNDADMSEVAQVE